MILDFLTTCSSIIKVSNYSNITYNMKSNNYTIKNSNDILSWNLMSDSVSSVNLIFISPNIKLLKEIDFNLVGSSNNADIFVTIEYSLDYINWNELHYYTNLKDSGEKFVYKSIKSNENTYYYNTTTKKVQYGYEIDHSNLTYTFTSYNLFSKETNYLYDNLEFKYIKMTISNIKNTSTYPLHFSRLHIYIEEELDDNCIDTNLLEYKASMFTKPKIFEEYEFFPDIITNYLKMLEEKNNPHDSRNYTDTCLCHDNIAFYPDPEGIGNDIVGQDTVIYI